MILLNSNNSKRNLYTVISNVGFFSTIYIKWNIIQYWIWKSLCFLFFELSFMNIHNFIYNFLWIYFAHIYIFILFLFKELLCQFLYICIQIFYICYLYEIKKKENYIKYTCIHKKCIKICIRICNLLLIRFF